VSAILGRDHPYLKFFRVQLKLSFKDMWSPSSIFIYVDIVWKSYTNYFIDNSNYRINVQWHILFTDIDQLKTTTRMD